MFVDFLYELRARKVPVGAMEAVALARALVHDLHQSSLDGFYHVARALCVHSEDHLDDFDLAFAKHFRGVAVEAKAITEELLDWLRDPIPMRELSQEEKGLLEAMELEDVLRELEKRIAEQRERHDGGSYWVGTGGTSPFGRGGYHPSGVRVGPRGGGGGKSAMQLADARAYRPYRSDLVLDVRQVEIALRKLRAFTREGAITELDVEGTIDATAKNAGELEVVVRPPRRPATRVLLMMDVGGSMDPYAHLVSQLFSAAKRATHWKELRTFYFHNCVYGKVYGTEGFEEPLSVEQLFRETGPHYKLVLVGDASMAPYELMGYSGWVDVERVPGITWLTKLREHFPKSVWLNPEGTSGYGHATVDAVRGVFPMFPLTIEGLGEAVRSLLGAARA